MTSDFTRKKLIQEARQLGGLAIPHLKLQVHQNGAKFPISRVYIEDEQLDSNTFYTIIAIPEPNKHNGIVLSYFNRSEGPLVYSSYPENVLEEEEKIDFADIMDSAIKEGFFTHRFITFFALNYYFEIPSDWARGHKEMAMLSCITDLKPNGSLEKATATELENIISSIKQIPGLFKAFYLGNAPNKSDIPEIEKTYQCMQKTLITLGSAFERILADIRWKALATKQAASENPE